MSLRAEQTATCFRPTHARTLEHVLRIGAPETSASEPARTVEMAGLTISTDPKVWTRLTNEQLVTLKIFAVDYQQFRKKANDDPDDPNAGYYETKFYSELYSPPDHYFYLEYLDDKEADDIEWYVLARPRSDTETYVRGRV